MAHRQAGLSGTTRRENDATVERIVWRGIQGSEDRVDMAGPARFPRPVPISKQHTENFGLQMTLWLPGNWRIEKHSVYGARETAGGPGAGIDIEKDTTWLHTEA